LTLKSDKHWQRVCTQLTIGLATGLSGCAVQSGSAIQLTQLTQPAETVRASSPVDDPAADGAWGITIPRLLPTLVSNTTPTPPELPTGNVAGNLADTLPSKQRDGVPKIGKPYQVAGRWYTPSHQPNYEASGTASWYGPEFDGKKTASGEIYNKNRLTAAHPTLPLPSYVSVTNKQNGRTLILRVNDRGPYAHGRIIDVSQRGAEFLGFARAGTGTVTVRYIGPAPMSADDRYEQAFLAKQQLLVGGPRLAVVPGDSWTAAMAQ
jgi:rare lipoprotein A (peptidoglycan hydrolase)